ncbi:unnamed protein product [Medioppia subpectinata]|uniref:ABC transporter domain-containing protein n=1 Tax=Medioppia subpectinata TaxID=1979941 RepID=A0A7R9L061_9ACAR|nr:unnamed protein product [Medioppia subpectinata]CAG2112831.1 unnamed protein product [Medioppia subpectinata]
MTLCASGYKNKVLIEFGLDFEPEHGSVTINSLNALMGPSGAGKTTLFKCLNGQNSLSLSINTKIYAINNRRVRSAFVKSDVWEHLLPGLTVRQTLLYASRLKNSSISIELNHNKIVTDLMSELAIGDTADIKVETCSGGEQKRIIIGCELTSHIKPNMLCIDEPTSGLDSNAAEMVINTLKVLTRKNGMTIIASIHQPNNDIFNMFDNIYVLANGGVCLYSGVPQHLRQHLTDNGIECHENQVPIEVLLKIASKLNGIEMCDTIDATLNNNHGINNVPIVLANLRPVFGSLSTSKRFSFNDIYYLMCRSLTHTFRCRRASVLVQMVTMVTIAATMRYIMSPDIIVPDGCLDIDFGADCTQSDAALRDEILIKHNIKYNILLLLSVALVVLIIMSATFGQDFCLFRSEQQNGWYSTGAYLWCRTIVDTIPVLLSLPLFCWIANLYNTYAYYWLTFVLNLLVIWCTQSVAQISAILYIDEPTLALVLALMAQSVVLMLGNNLIPVKELHYTLQALSQLSYSRLSFECIMIIIYGLGRCPGDQLSTVLYELGIDDGQFWPNIIRLCGVCVLLKIIAFVVAHRHRSVHPMVLKAYTGVELTDVVLFGVVLIDVRAVHVYTVIGYGAVSVDVHVTAVLVPRPAPPVTSDGPIGDVTAGPISALPTGSK